MTGAKILSGELAQLPPEFKMLCEVIAAIARRSASVDYAEFIDNADAAEIALLESVQTQLCNGASEVLEAFARYIDAVAEQRPAAAQVLARVFHMLIPPHAG